MDYLSHFISDAQTQATKIAKQASEIVDDVTSSDQFKETATSFMVQFGIVPESFDNSPKVLDDDNDMIMMIDWKKA